MSTADLARAAGLDPAWLVNAVRRVRAHHPLDRDQLVTECLARRWWHDAHPGRQIANGRTTVEHLAALAVQVNGYSPEAFERERVRRNTTRAGYRGSAVEGVDWLTAFNRATRRWDVAHGRAGHPWARDNTAAYGTAHRPGPTRR